MEKEDREEREEDGLKEVCIRETLQTTIGSVHQILLYSQKLNHLESNYRFESDDSNSSDDENDENDENDDQNDENDEMESENKTLDRVVNSNYYNQLKIELVLRQIQIELEEIESECRRCEVILNLNSKSKIGSDTIISDEYLNKELELEDLKFKASQLERLITDFKSQDYRKEKVIERMKERNQYLVHKLATLENTIMEQTIDFELKKKNLENQFINFSKNYDVSSSSPKQEQSNSNLNTNNHINYKSELNALNLKFQQEISNLKNENKKNLANMKEKYENRIYDLQTEHKHEITKLKAQSEQTALEWEKLLKAERGKLREKERQSAREKHSQSRPVRSSLSEFVRPTTTQK